MSISRTKPWTVMLYLVAEPSTDETDLDKAVIAEVESIARAAAKYLDRMHVAIQVDFNHPDGIFRQVIDERGVMDLRTAKCEDESSPGDQAVLRRFIAWTNQRCPAERHAVFFWGHSLGPAGMFQAGDEGPILSPEILSSPDRMRELLVRYKVPRRKRTGQAAAPPPPPVEEIDPPQILSLPELASALGTVTGDPSKPLDLLVFKDCFMSTLETAYELAPVVNFQVGSQSLIPVHRKAPSAAGEKVPEVWPYERMFASMVPAAHGDDVREIGRDVLDALGDHYKVDDNLGTNKDVPCTLLDLRKIDAVTAPLNKLVTALKSLDQDARAKTIAKTAAGDPALVDVVTMCKRFPALPEAAAVERAIERHIVAHASRTKAFTGISLFYSPPGSGKAFLGLLTGSLFPVDYGDLRVSTKTTWQKLAFENS